jgi:hypothetical protein
MTDMAETRLVLTDALIAESLRRGKQEALAREADMAVDVALAVAALLVPAAVVLAVLGIGVAGAGRPSAFRGLAAGASGVLLVAAVVGLRGDVGTATTAAAWAGLVLAMGAAAAIVVDVRTDR